MAIVQLKGYKCERCNHSWLPRSKIDELPIICPKCKSPYWNTPRRSGVEIARKYVKRKKSE